MISAINKGGSDSKVRISSTDGSSDFLENKLHAGSFIALTKLNSGTVEHYDISVSGLVQNHNDLSNVQGGSSSEQFHLTSLEHINATQVANASQSGLLSSQDWNLFNSKSGVDNKVSISASDTTSGYLINKLSAGSNITIQQLNSGSIETIEISTLTSGIIPDHNDLLNIQGGDNTNRWHLSQTQYSNAIQAGSSVQSGLITPLDWSLFNNKENAISKGNFTEAISSVLNISNGINSVIGSGITVQVKQATSGVAGYLSSTDWNTFNNKVSSTRNISTSLPLNGGGNLSEDLTLSMPPASATGSGYLKSTDWTIFNNKQDKLNNSAGLASALSDETGSGLVVFNNNPTIINPSVDLITFDSNINNPSYKEGEVFYDRSKHTISYYNDSSEMTVNLGQESIIRVKNNTGSVISNGVVVYPAGTDGSEILIGLADAHDKEKCRLVGLTTQTIGVGEIGYVTKFGEVADVNTSSFTSGVVVYLSDSIPGALTDIRPSDGSYITRIGAIKKVGITDGSIVVDINTSEFTVESSQTLGFSTSHLATISSSDTNSGCIITITPSSDEFCFYQYGDKYTKTTDSIHLPDEEGLFTVYYNLGTLTYIKNATDTQTDSLIRNNPVVCYCYWNAVDNKCEYLGLEMHKIGMEAITHAYLHFNFRSRWTYGLAPNTVSADASGDLNTSAQFGIDAGGIVDEDLYHPTAAVGSTTGLPIYYISGTLTNPTLRGTSNSGYSVLTTGTGRLAYNTLSGSNFVLSEVGNGHFVCCHIIATNENNSNRRVFSLVGQTTYTSIANARTGAQTELENARLIGIVPQEIKAIATFIFETNNTYSNAVKARIRTISTGVNYIDWRNTQIAATAGAGTFITNSFNDSLFQLYDNVDFTKILQFDATNITTSTTRTITAPNRDLNLATPIFDSITTNGVITSTVSSGTAPFIVASNTVVGQLNADLWDGNNFEDYINQAVKTTSHPTFDHITLTAGAVSTTDATPKSYVDSFFPVQESNMFLNNNTTWNVSTTKHGFAPILPGNANQFLNGQGNYTTPSSGVANNYSSTSFVNQSSVQVVHNFGGYPIVQVIIGTAVEIPYSITHNTINDFTVGFSSAQSGTIIATLGSPQAQATKTITGNYSALTTDRILEVTAAGVVVSLYTAVNNSGRELIVDNSSTGDITLSGVVGQTIQGLPTQTIPSDCAIHTYSNGTNWRIY